MELTGGKILVSRSGDLKTMEEILTETTTLVSNLTDAMDATAMRLKETFNEEITKIQGQARDHFEKILLEHRRSTMQLETSERGGEEKKNKREPDNPTKSCKARGSDLRVHFKVV